MSGKNAERCPTLKREGVNLNQSAYSPKNNGCPTPIERRNKIKSLCLECWREECIYYFL